LAIRLPFVLVIFTLTIPLASSVYCLAFLGEEYTKRAGQSFSDRSATLCFLQLGGSGYVGHTK